MSLLKGFNINLPYTMMGSARTKSYFTSSFFCYSPSGSVYDRSYLSSSTDDLTSACTELLLVVFSFLSSSFKIDFVSFLLMSDVFSRDFLVITFLERLTGLWVSLDFDLVLKEMGVTLKESSLVNSIDCSFSGV